VLCMSVCAAPSGGMRPHLRPHLTRACTPHVVPAKRSANALLPYFSQHKVKSALAERVHTNDIYERRCLRGDKCGKAWPVGNSAFIKKNRLIVEEECVIESQACKLCSSSVRSPFYDYPDCCGPLGHPSQT